MVHHTYTSVFKLCLITIITLSFCFRAGAQDTQQTHIARLKTGDIRLSSNTAKWIDSMRGKASTEPVLTFIHFNTLPTEQQKEELKKQGITLLEYVPNNTFSAFVRFPLATNNGALKPVYSIVNVKPEWKANEYVWNKVKEQKGAIEILVSFYAGITATQIREFIAATGAQAHAGPMEQHGSYKLIVAADKVRGVAEWYGVQCISPVTDMVPYDLQSRPTVKGNISLASVANGGYGLTGDSVTVGVGDNASGIYHADINDRITNFNPAPMRAHGSHVNGIVGGSGNIDPFAEGMAPHVSLLDHLYDQVLFSTGAMYHNYNMTITNNSYGVLLGDCSYSGTYDGYAQFLDTLALQYPDVLHVFASANDGWMTCSPYPNGYATVGGGYTSAKNNVVVGSMTDFLYRADDESRGPTKDGRLKPETIAIGLGAYSTIGVDDYEWAAGTSMASPQVAGGLAVLTQHYKHLNGGITPRADLLKAILLNGTMDLGNPGPDFNYGFGAMDVSRSLKIIDNARYHIDTISNGELRTFNLTVPSGTAQLKVMLVYHDKIANTSSAIQLINDLDLTVTTPTGTVHLPLVPDGASANVNNVATEKVDHLNNTEQVTINSPSAGTYNIKVSGFNVPFPSQRYVLAYDFVPTGTQLTYPIGGEQVGNVDSIRIFWNTADNGHTFTAQYSSDNGSNWITISDSIKATDRYCAFSPAGINSGNCKVKVIKNGTSETAISASFSINAQPVLALDTAQCPGYVNIHWSPVPNATSYQLLAKQGKYMQLAGTATDTTYSFSGMSLTERSYVAVRPIVNGKPGYRSKAITRIAGTGNCTKIVSNGDLMLEKAISPVSGRMYTAGQLGVNETLSIRIRNLYAAAANNYTVGYSINGGAWQSFVSTTPIPAKGFINYSITGIDLSVAGQYHFTVAVHNQSATDPQPINDTISFTVVNLLNDTITLPFAEDFEGMGVLSLMHDSLGVSPNGHWDFQTHDTAGRMRTFVDEDITIGGIRSISLDEDRNVSDGSNNLFTGTFNLAAYDTGVAEIRMDFDYILHAIPKTAAGNIVTYRANEASSWLPLFSYDLTVVPGSLNKAKSISLNDAVRAENTNFARNMQIAFGQNDTSLIATSNYGNGLTIDNLKLYTVANDAQLVKVITPLPTNCGLSAAQPLVVQIHNGVNYTLHNVAVSYKLDGGTVSTDILDSITAKNTIDHSFTQLLNMPEGSTHTVDVWLSATGDTYLPNDSVVSYKFRNNKVITAYPYLENFEAGNGGYYHDGIKSSWQFGTPASHNINRAASGVKAWKTNLLGLYGNLETSYLYTPCFDLSTLAAPMLSFSAALDIENCGNIMCDKAYVEYSIDGINWLKLGSAGLGTNWYDSLFNVWNSNGFTRWHVASIPLPAVPTGSTISFRFALITDPGATFEGFAIDDVHVFDKANGIFPASGATTITNDVTGLTWQNYLQDNQLVAALQRQSQVLLNTAITLYEQSTVSNPTATQYTMPRSYKIEPAQNLGDSISVRLYLLESDMVKVLNDTSCPSCPRPSAYSLGITQYNNINKPSIINDKLADDTGGVFTYRPYKQVQWVPYDKGYYAQFKTKSTGEFWFNDGGPTNGFDAATDYLNFAAWKDGSDVQASWKSLIDATVNKYYLERSVDGVHFTSILDTAATHHNPTIYSKKDFTGILSSTIVYYRLRWTMTGNATSYYSPIRKIDLADPEAQSVNFTAQMINRDAALALWTSYIDGIADHYVLEREINNRGYMTLSTTPSHHHYGQQYNFTDIPGSEIPRGAMVNYKLTATLDDGSTQVFIRTLEWADDKSVTNIYPNPSTDGNFTMEWYAQAGTIMDLNLTDIAGRSIFKTSVQASQWKNTTTIETSYKAKGVYILTASFGEKRYSTKIVFE